MNKQQTAQLITLIKRSYPNSFNNQTEQQTMETMLVWADLFKDYPFEIVQKALKDYIMSNNSPWAPSPGQLNAIIASYVTDQDDQLNGYQAWDLVLKTMQSSEMHYHPEEAYKSLPEIVRDCIGSYNVLKEWSLTDYNDLKFIKNNFLQRFKEQKEYKQDRLKLPDVIIPMLDKLKLLDDDAGKQQLLEDAGAGY